MRVATWNVNSLRARVDRVGDYLERAQIDVLLMQEIKCKPDQAPVLAFEAAGYEVALHGLNQWNGVGIASRGGLAAVAAAVRPRAAFGKPGQDAVVEARAVGATCGPLRAWSVCVPDGSGIAGPHYPYTRRLLAHLAAAAAGWASRPTVIG